MKQLMSPPGSSNFGKKTVRIAVYCILTVAVIVTAIPSYIKEVKPGFISIHVLQADAFLHGRLSVGNADELGAYELSVFEGKKYVCLPPFPSILLMPVVAIWGMNTHFTYLGLIELKRTTRSSYIHGELFDRRRQVNSQMALSGISSRIQLARNIGIPKLRNSTCFTA